MRSLTRRQLLSVVAAVCAAKAAPKLDPARYRLGITTDEVDDDLAVAIKFLQEFGLRHAEIRNLWGKYNTSQPVEKIREARRMLDAAGIEVAIVDTSFFKVPLPPEGAAGNATLDDQWRLLERAFERARLFGTDLIRTFAFMHPKDEQPNEAHYARIIELVKDSARRARAAGFRLALENVGGSYVATAAHSARILKGVKDDALGLTWDPNNSARSGDPRPFPDGYRLLDPKRIYHVHLRDYRRLPDGSAEWCGVGQGEFDHAGQIRALLADGYEGALSLETHFTIDGSKKKASEFSMRALLAVLEQV